MGLDLPDLILDPRLSLGLRTSLARADRKNGHLAPVTTVDLLGALAVDEAGSLPSNLLLRHGFAPVTLEDVHLALALESSAGLGKLLTLQCLEAINQAIELAIEGDEVVAYQTHAFVALMRDDGCAAHKLVTARGLSPAELARAALEALEAVDPRYRRRGRAPRSMAFRYRDLVPRIEALHMEVQLGVVENQHLKNLILDLTARLDEVSGELTEAQLEIKTLEALHGQLEKQNEALLKELSKGRVQPESASLMAKAIQFGAVSLVQLAIALGGTYAGTVAALPDEQVAQLQQTEQVIVNQCDQVIQVVGDGD